MSGRATIRHKNCEYLLSHAQETRCSQCKSHRRSLHVMLKRLEPNPNSSTSVSSHGNCRYLPMPLLMRRARNIRKKYLLARRRIARMRMRVKELVARKGVNVNNEMEDDLHKIMENNLTRIAKQFPPNSFQRIFWEQHAKASACKNPRGIRWHPAMIRWCLYLRHLSGKA